MSNPSLELKCIVLFIPPTPPHHHHHHHKHTCNEDKRYICVRVGGWGWNQLFSLRVGFIQVISSEPLKLLQPNLFLWPQDSDHQKTSVYPVSAELLNLLHLAEWYIIMGQSVVQRGWNIVLKNQGHTVRIHTDCECLSISMYIVETYLLKWGNLEQSFKTVFLYITLSCPSQIWCIATKLSVPDKVTGK